jgi:hypothetical protein
MERGRKRDWCEKERCWGWEGEKERRAGLGERDRKDELVRLTQVS